MKPNFSKIVLFSVFFLLLVLAVAMHFYQWRYQLRYPTTQLGQVKANVIPVLAPISGPITTVYVKQHSIVRRGDLLAQIDPAPYQAAIANAENSLLRIKEEAKKKQNSVNSMERQVEKNQSDLSEIAKLAYQIQTLVQDRELPKSAANEAQQQLKFAGDALETSFQQLDKAYIQLGKRGLLEARIKNAEAVLQQAKLNLAFTEIASPVDGYVNDLNLRVGNQITARQPILFLVENNEWWVEAVFSPGQIKRIHPKQIATIKLNPYSQMPLQGLVESIQNNIVKIRISNANLEMPLQIGAQASVVVDTTQDSPVIKNTLLRLFHE